MKQTLLKTLRTLAGALTIVTLLAPAAHAEDKPTVIRIAHPGAGTGGRPLGDYTYISLAKHLGSLEKEFAADGIKVQWTFYPGAGPAVNEAAANNLVDFSIHGDLPLIVGRSTGIKHKIILGGGRFGPVYFTVPSDSSAKSLADLKGKTISTFKGTAGQLQLYRLLERNGLSEKDFTIITQNSDNTKASLATKSIDGAIISPWDLQARGIAKPLLEIKRDPKITSVGTFWVSEEFEKKYPQITQRVVNTLVKVAYWSAQEQNRTKLFQYWSQAGNTPYSDYLRNYQGYQLKEINTPLLDEYYQATLQRAVNEAKKYRLIRHDVSLDGWIEPKYLQAALKEQHLEGFWDQYDANGNVKK
jgi:sulfonate transport system substrate-binding protein